MEISPDKPTEIEIYSASVFYGNERVLENLSLSIREQRVGFIGRNGSGKTTLLRTLIGLIRPEKGSINWLDNENNFHKYRSFECFFQGHELGIKNLLTVFENLELTHNAKGMNKEQIQECLKRVGLKNINDLASNLSVGQKKRISIARWLLKDFKIYFIDEPFSALDDEATNLIESLIKELNFKGCSFVITGHRPSNILANRLEI